ncbi:MAG: hypothetical protein G01um10143_513 [Parcubacteria group bacterium Gr01-1014_3]|nr:MAG: hypothetical protein G01um10143_513 [Parcubacteria group bacterium Gr01-1014_3]
MFIGLGELSKAVEIRFMNGDVRTIDAVAIRKQTDPSFRERCEKMAQEQAKEIGRRIHVIRIRKKLTLDKVAGKCSSLDANDIARLELGEGTFGMKLLSEVMAAMGCEFADFAKVASKK